MTFLALKWEGRPLHSVGLLLNRRWLAEGAAGALIGFGVMALAAIMVFGLGGCHWERNTAVGFSLFLQTTWFFLIAAAFEEILSRGYGFQRLLDGIGAWPAMIIFAVLFSLMHRSIPKMTNSARILAILNLALASILFSLALPIGFHLGWNWTMGNLLGFVVSGKKFPGWLRVIIHDRPQWLTGGDFCLEASLPLNVLCILLIIAMALWKGTRSGEMGKPRRSL